MLSSSRRAEICDIFNECKSCLMIINWYLKNLTICSHEDIDIRGGGRVDVSDEPAVEALKLTAILRL